MKVGIICEFSGIVREEFVKRGHHAVSYDLLPSELPGHHVQGDATSILLPNANPNWRWFDLIIFHPPCTYLTCAGNKWMKPEYAKRFPDRKRQREEAIKFFMIGVNAYCDKIAIENPVGIMSSHYRKPDQIIQPYQFGHPIRKTTCLWLKGLPKLKPTRIVEPELDRFPSGNCQSKWHTETGHIRNKHERMKARSRTHQGIAEAMAEQWG